MTDTICNDTAYQNMIKQRQRFQLFNIPPMRYNNLDNNPYINVNTTTGKKFTKFDLDMRRKAEILKYKANNSSSQTNNLTKAEVYVQAVTGKYQQRTYPNYYIIENTSDNRIESCPVNIKTPTSSSDVPGRIINLYQDDNVPLYNYNNTMIDSNFGFSTQGINPYDGKKTWNYHTDSDVPSTISSNKLTANIASIFIYHADVPSKIFTITTPISLKVTGSKTTSTQNSSVNFTITSISTKILFNDNPIATITTTSNINNNSSQSFTIPMTTSTQTQVTYYLGLLKITNVRLPFQKGYIYDIQPEIAHTITPSNATITSSSVVFNVGTTPTQLNNLSYHATSITSA